MAKKQKAAFLFIKEMEKKGRFRFEFGLGAAEIKKNYIRNICV